MVSFHSIMLKETTKPLFQKISSYECRKNWYADEWSRPAPMAKSAVTAVTTALHRLLSAATAVKCSAEFTGIIAAANPSSGDALADWNLPGRNAMQEPSMKRYYKAYLVIIQMQNDGRNLWIGTQKSCESYGDFAVLNLFFRLIHARQREQTFRFVVLALAFQISGIGQ